MDNNKNMFIKLNFKYFIIAFFTIVLTSALSFSLSTTVINLVLAFITIPQIFNKYKENSKVYILIYLFAILFVFLFYYGSYLKFGTPYFNGGSDDLEYEIYSQDLNKLDIFSISEAFEKKIVPEWYNAAFYILLLTWIIKIAEFFGGYSTFIPRLLNVYLLIWSCLIFENLLRKHTNLDDKKIKIIIAIIGLTPNILYINSFIFRDTLNLFQLLLSIYLIDIILSRKKIINKLPLMMILIGIIYTLVYTRKSSIVFLLAIVIILILHKLKVKRYYFLIPIGIPMIIFSGILEKIGLISYSKLYSNYIVDNTGTGLSRFVFGQSLFPFGLLLRMLYAFISPFPNFFGLFRSSNEILYDIGMLMVYLGTVIQILFIFFIIKRIFKFDFLSLCFGIVFLGVIMTTFTFRHVLLYYPFFVTLGVDQYFSTPKHYRRLIIIFTFILSVIAGLIYFIIKFY